MRVIMFNWHGHDINSYIRWKLMELVIDDLIDVSFGLVMFVTGLEFSMTSLLQNIVGIQNKSFYM